MNTQTKLRCRSSDGVYLCQDIKSIAETANCEYQVFLPAIPIDTIARDPLCFFTTRPLKYLVQFVRLVVVT